MSLSMKATSKGQGTYLYCVADSGEVVNLGGIGLEHCEVYTIVHRDICAVVHSCNAEPYLSSNDETLKTWIIAHQTVIDTAWKRWGNVLPSGFDTIIKGEAERGSDENVRLWLEVEYNRLKSCLEKLRGKAEYGVQIFWDSKAIAREIAETSEEILKIEAEIRAKPKGLAYMHRQKLELLLRKELEARAELCFKEYYDRITKHVDDARVEKTKKAEHGTQMLMNLSCLASEDDCTELGKELERINALEAFSVRFTGPWPPYSFVGRA